MPLLPLIDGSWVESATHVLKLGVLPVKAELVVGEHVWASSGGQIFIINTQTHTVEVKQHFLPPHTHFCINNNVGHIVGYIIDIEQCTICTIVQLQCVFGSVFNGPLTGCVRQRAFGWFCLFYDMCDTISLWSNVVMSHTLMKESLS